MVRPSCPIGGAVAGSAPERRRDAGPAASATALPNDGRLGPRGGAAARGHGVVMIVCGPAAVIRHDAGDWRRYVRNACAGLRA
ncbi:hypothetical protein [Streptomyces lydicamycinicus]|uniref:hypothetical protein n=1 Tax=Streptomyces lydicamycinicus TaxID=1546107 RepID=UPI003C2CF556